MKNKYAINSTKSAYSITTFRVSVSSTVCLMIPLLTYQTRKSRTAKTPSVKYVNAVIAQAKKNQHIRHAFVEQEAFDVPWRESLKIDAEYMKMLG